MYHGDTTTVYVHSPYFTVLHRNTTESEPYIHLGPHLQLPYEKVHLHMLKVPNSEVEALNILSQVHLQASDGSLKDKGCFVQCLLLAVVWMGYEIFEMGIISSNELY